MLKTLTALAATSLALVACGQPSATEDSNSDATTTAADGMATEASGARSTAVTTQAPTTVAAPPPAALPQIEPNVFRNGQFAIRVESAVLNYSNDHSRELTLRLTLSLHNTGGEPMAVTMLTPNQTANVVLDNGIELQIGARGNGIGACNYKVTDCRARASDQYTQIDPGATVSSNFVFYERLKDAQQSGLSAISTGNLAMRLHVVEGASDRVAQASILNITLRNEIR